MQKSSMNRWIGLIFSAVFALTACTPDARSVTTPEATEQLTSSGVSSPTPDLSPYYGDRLPAAVLILGEQQQTAGVGTSTWTVEKKGEEKTIVHADAFALVTPTEPLTVTSPFTATLMLPIPAAPESLVYEIKPVSENLRRSDPDQEFTSWQVAIGGAGTSLALETQQEIPLSLKPGKYVMEVYATWAELGSVDYGFFIKVQEEADSNATAPTETLSTSSPPPKPTSSPVYTCADILRLPTDSPEAQQIVNESVAKYKEQHPTEAMGMAILHRVDRLGEWAIVTGSIVGEGKDVIVVRRTPQGYEIAEHIHITSPLESAEDFELRVAQPLLIKLPDAPPVLFTCPEQDWLLAGGYPREPSGVFQLAYLSTDDYTTEGVTEIDTLQSDGTNHTTILSEPMLIMDLVSSPDGEQIAFWGCPGSLANDCLPAEDLDVWMVNWDGSNLRNLTEDSAANDSHPDWSPDGGQIVFDSDRAGDPQIYVMNADGSKTSALTQGPGRNTEPKWSPDGKWIAYYCMQGGETRVCVISPDGQPAGEPLSGTTPVWSPAGLEGGIRLAFLCFQDSHSDICTTQPDGSELANLTNSPGDEHSPAWSPDGGWLAFVSNQGDDVDVYKVCATCPKEPAVVRLTDELRAVDWPAWSPDGGQLAYVDIGGGDLLLVNADRSDATWLTGGVFGPPIWRP